MNWWMLYPLIGAAIGIGLVSVDAIDVDSPVLFILLVWLWPLAVPFLIWHRHGHSAPMEDHEQAARRSTTTPSRTADRCPGPDSRRR